MCEYKSDTLIEPLALEFPLEPRPHLMKKFHEPELENVYIFLWSKT